MRAAESLHCEKIRFRSHLVLAIGIKLERLQVPRARVLSAVMAELGRHVLGRRTPHRCMHDVQFLAIVMTPMAVLTGFNPDPPGPPPARPCRASSIPAGQPSVALAELVHQARSVAV